MPRRMDIELTSARPDGTWTWRAAGAKEPKGVVGSSLLPTGATVGDVLKVEADVDIDGITVLSVVTSSRSRKEPTRLELLPSQQPFEAVTQQLARRGPREDNRREPRGDGSTRERRPPRQGQPDRGAPRPDQRPRRDKPAGDRPPRPAHEPPGDQRDRPRREARPPRPPRPAFTPPPEMPQRPKPKRLKPGRTHRNEVLAALPEEQRPIAELTLQGLAAVRQRLRDDNAKARAEGRPEMPEPSVMKMAEELLPKVRVAEWRDRAEAAKRDLDSLDLRDLRSVVASAEDPIVVRDDSTRELAAELKAALAVRQEQATREWLEDIDTAVGIGRVVRALKLAAEPPKAGTRLPAELSAKLSGAASAALTPEATAERWLTLLEAVAFSPVRLLVKPAGIPDPVTDDLRAAVVRLAAAIPQIAVLFDVHVAEGAPLPKPPRVMRRPEKKPSKPAGAERPRTPEPTGATPPVAAAPSVADSSDVAVEVPADVGDAVSDAPDVSDDRAAGTGDDVDAS